MRFAGKIALITASANGIGRATAGIMARDGATVICVDNHQERLDAAIDSITKEGGNVHPRLCNALDQAQVFTTILGGDDPVKELDRLLHPEKYEPGHESENEVREAERELRDWQRDQAVKRAQRKGQRP